MSQSITSSPPFQAERHVRPDLTVVIVSWNVRDLLVRCVRAILSDEVSGGLQLEVIVVDNASTDSSVAALQAFPDVKVIETGANLGYGKANNLGFEAATGRHLLALNPDTVPLPGCLTALLSFLEAHPRAAIVSPRLLNPDGSVQPAAFKFPTLAMAALDLFPLPRFVPGRVRQAVIASTLNGRFPREASATRPFRIGHPLGACMLINFEAYRKVGGFDPGLQMYSEEIDLALRYAQAGRECWQVPAARVVHLGGQSTRQLPDRMFVELWRSRLYIYRKYRPRATRLALGALLVISQLHDATGALVELGRGHIRLEEARRRWRRAGAVLRLVFRQ